MPRARLSCQKYSRVEQSPKGAVDGRVEIVHAAAGFARRGGDAGEAVLRIVAEKVAVPPLPADLVHGPSGQEVAPRRRRRPSG
jgi:hypothetical protein